jgi:lipoate-protein ligase A
VLESYSRLAKALLRAVQDLNLPVEMKEGKADESGKSNPVCFEVPSTYEITVGGKKLIGSAQARRKEGVLQHGSLPLTGDLTRITEALSFADESARADAATRLLARAATAESALGRAVDWDTAAQAFIHAFESELGIHFERGKLSEKEKNRIEELVREKYGNPSWTERV